MHACEVCSYPFTRKFNLQKHMNTIHWKYGGTEKVQNRMTTTHGNEAEPET